MSLTFDEFIKNNEIRIGEGKDFTVTPPLYYQSLNDAFLNYFKTLRNNRDTYHFLIDPSSWDRKSIAFSFSNSTSSVFTILGFHRFFELLLKDLLNRLKPELAVKYPNNAKKTIKYLYGEIGTEDLQSIEFQEAYNRFKEVCSIREDFEDQEAISEIVDFSFLQNDDTLLKLAFWRNRIMHNGTTLPNILQLDYLVTQRIIPLILKVIDTDHVRLNNKSPYYFKTLSGLEIVNELSKIEFDFVDFTDPDKQEEVGMKLITIAHLKELGRAACNVDIQLAYNKTYYDSYYDNPIGKYERFAESERSHDSFHAIKKCPCCGLQTLVVYRQSFNDIFEQKESFISWLNCVACSYSLKNNLGDPYYFGLSAEILFAEK